MKRLLPLLLSLLCFAAWAQTPAPFIRLPVPSEETSYASGTLSAPVLICGVCSPDIVSIAVTWMHKDQEGNTVAPPAYQLKKFKVGDTSFIYRAHFNFGNYAEGTNTYIFSATTKSGNVLSAKKYLFFTRSVGERAKPVIYLYPTKDTVVRVNVRPREGFKLTIPPIGDGWRVQASPSGLIKNLADGKTYPYLFWESPDSSAPFKPEKGFMVERNGLDAFFRAKLAWLGLSPSETDDFLEFWLPLLQDKPWYAIAFTPREIQDSDAPLEIQPPPDSLIRVYFQYLGMETPIALPPQVLEEGRRQGFTAVEWGGRRM